MEKQEKNIYFVIYSCAVLIVLAVAIGPLLMGKSYVKRQIYDYSDAWYYDSQCTKPADLTKVNEYMTSTQNTSVCYYAILPKKINPGYCLWFRAKNVDYQVYLDMEEVTLSKNMGPFYSNFAGTIWECIPLDQEYAGKMVRIIVTPRYDDSSCYIDNVKVGFQKEIIISAIRSRLAGAITCILLMFTGVILIIAYCILRKRVENDIRQLLYLGCFSIMTSLWALSETKILQLFLDNTTAIHMLSCMSLMLIMPPLFLFFSSDVNTFVVKIMLAVPMINFVCNMVLDICEIADLHQTLTITHFSIVFCATGVFYANYVRCFRNKERTHEDIWAAAGMIIFTIFGIIDIIRYRRGGIEDSSLFTRIGLLIYVLILSACSLSYIFQMIRKGMTAEFISHLAYEDGLTGLGNRTAYMEQITELQGKSCTVFMFDINNLKYVNDQYGHQVGDRMIKQGANLIKEIFGSLGDCFRIGGDEFVCLIQDQKNKNELVSQFYKKMDESNLDNSLPIPLVIAVGAAIYSGEGDLNASIHIADKLMYEKKSELKKMYILPEKKNAAE